MILKPNWMSQPGQFISKGMREEVRVHCNEGYLKWLSILSVGLRCFKAFSTSATHSAVHQVLGANLVFTIIVPPGIQTQCFNSLIEQ